VRAPPSAASSIYVSRIWCAGTRYLHAVGIRWTTDAWFHSTCAPAAVMTFLVSNWGGPSSPASAGPWGKNDRDAPEKQGLVCGAIRRRHLVLAGSGPDSGPRLSEQLATSLPLHKIAIKSRAAQFQDAIQARGQSGRIWRSFWGPMNWRADRGFEDVPWTCAREIRLTNQ